MLATVAHIRDAWYSVSLKRESFCGGALFFVVKIAVSGQHSAISGWLWVVGYGFLVIGDW
jgi:hypothetical protein